jgi:hypothetical protein
LELEACSLGLEACCLELLSIWHIDAPLHLVSMWHNVAAISCVNATYCRTLGACGLELGAWSLRPLSIGHIDARQFAARPGEFFIILLLLAYQYNLPCL